MREQQIVPSLSHHPATAWQWPRAMFSPMENIGHQDDVCLPSSETRRAKVDVRQRQPHSEYTLRLRSGIEFSACKMDEMGKRSEIMQRKASAVWQGDLKSGKGSISTDSGTLKQTQYSFSTRFENGVGTNPEELLAAAHAGCFTMALSAQLGGAGYKAEKLETTATITLDKVGDGFSITKSHLDVVAKVPGADKAKFDAAVKAAETGCPVSKLFKAEISVSARLES
jgi:osmotically inducible protein OsmC